LCEAQLKFVKKNENKSIPSELKIKTGKAVITNKLKIKRVFQI